MLYSILICDDYLHSTGSSNDVCFGLVGLGQFFEREQFYSNWDICFGLLVFFQFEQGKVGDFSKIV